MIFVLFISSGYPGPRPMQSWSSPWQEEWLKSQGKPVSVQKAPNTFGLTSPTFDWQNAPTNLDPSAFFLTLNPWLVVFPQGWPPVAFMAAAFSFKTLISSVPYSIRSHQLLTQNTRNNCIQWLVLPCASKVVEFVAVEVNQSSKNLAAAPLLSPLMSVLSLLIEVPWVANQLKAPILFWLVPSTNFKSVIRVSTSRGYRDLSSGGLNRYALGLRFTPALSKSPTKMSWSFPYQFKIYITPSRKYNDENAPVLMKMEPDLRFWWAWTMLISMAVTMASKDWGMKPSEVTE